MINADDMLLVPSAVLVPNELRLDIGSVPTGMIPLEGKPMLEHLAEAYEGHDVTRLVAVNESSTAVRDYLARSEYQWTVLDVGNTTSLGATIFRSLNKFEQEELDGRNLHINFADTLVSPLPDIYRESVVSYQNRDKAYRWTTFEIEEGRITNPVQKHEHSGVGPQPCFTGHFGINDAGSFRQSLKDTPDQVTTGLDYFYRALLNYLSTTTYDLYKPDSWIDVGHLDTYHRSKKEFLNSREFNELENRGKNIITKRSDDSKTLIDEIEWYNAIPIDLQPYLPRIYDYSTEMDNPFVKMEYIGYPSLSDLQLYGSHGQHIWDSVFHQLFNMHSEFQSFTAEPGQNLIKQSLEEIYLEKTRRRLDVLRDDKRFTPFFDADYVNVNGVQYPDLDTILSHLDVVVKNEGLLTQDKLSIIHGDLCFPNILYDPRNEILKLIDPRGNFGEFTIYGDPRYDLGKLRHSAVGHYEHLINGQFEANVDTSTPELTYEVHTTPAQDQRETQFDEILSAVSDTDIKTVKLIEALLFLSMVPLHSDNFERQQSMLAQGIEKIAPYIP